MARRDARHMTPQKTGILVYVVGPSGSGKDTLLHYARDYFATNPPLKGQRDVIFVRRHITRPENAGGEDHIAVSREQFDAMSYQGHFAMEWHSHGLSYGITRQIFSWLSEGAVVVMNGSRAHLPKVLSLVPTVVVIEIFVQHDVLRRRLELRGREAQADIEERLSRAFAPLPPLTHHIRIDNSDDILSAQKSFSQKILSLRILTEYFSSNCNDNNTEKTSSAL